METNLFLSFDDNVLLSDCLRASMGSSLKIKKRQSSSSVDKFCDINLKSDAVVYPYRRIVLLNLLICHSSLSLLACALNETILLCKIWSGGIFHLFHSEANSKPFWHYTKLLLLLLFVFFFSLSLSLLFPSTRPAQGKEKRKSHRALSGSKCHFRCKAPFINFSFSFYSFAFFALRLISPPFCFLHFPKKTYNKATNNNNAE